MDPERWSRIQELLHGALDVAEKDRARWLARHCGADDALLTEVTELLAAHLAHPDFLERPIAELAALEPGRSGLEGEAGRLSAAPDLGPHFEILEPLGEGGMGQVFLVRQRTEAFDRRVAVKVVKRGMDTDEVLRRFETERRILATLVHPNIAQLLDAGATADGRPFFVMEYVDGQRIDRHVAEHGLALDATLDLFAACCSAVQHAHQQLVLHRDIKPGNVLVRGDGVVKLVDFGIARLVDPDARDGTPVTRTRARRLTPEYAAPEQLLGEPVSTTVDVHALGVLLFELLVGQTPWAEDTRTPEERARTRSTASIPRPSDVAARARDPKVRRAAPARRLRGDLDNIVLKAMHPDPERRYPSAAALSEDVERFRAGLPVRARPDSVAYRASKFARRHAWSVATAATLVLGLVGFSVAMGVQSRRVARERDKAREVQSFLLETFGATSADGNSADSTTVRQLLDGQAAIVRSAYDGDPELRAELLTVLGDAYHRLGLHGEAAELTAEALAERERLHAGDHPDVAFSLGLLGWIRHRQGESDEAVTLLSRSVDMWRRIGDRDGLARALNDLGSVHDQTGRTTEAEPLLREALALRRADGDSLDLGVAVTSNNLAALLYRRGEYAAAESLGAAAVEALRTSVGPDHQRTFVARSNLATFRWVAGDLEGAAEVYEELLASERAGSGGETARTATALTTYASLLRARGEPHAAEARLREALEIQERILEPDHPDLGNTTRILGIVLLQTGRPGEGLPFLERSRAVNATAYGRHRLLAESTEGVARAYEALGDARRAAVDYREAVTLFDETVGRAHPRTVQTRYRLAALLLGEGQPAGAAEVLRVTLRAIEGRGTASPPDIADARLRLAEAELRAGNVGVADSLALAVRSDPAHPVDADADARLARLDAALAERRR